MISEKDYKKYEKLPIEKWPNFKLSWDFDPKNFILTLDNYDEEGFSERYPNGFAVGLVSFKELNSKLAAHCVRDINQIWELGAYFKLARVIGHWNDGNKMTPIFVCFYNGELIIAAGFHRHAACIVKNPETIPILILPSEKDMAENLLSSIKWLDNASEQ